MAAIDVNQLEAGSETDRIVAELAGWRVVKLDIPVIYEGIHPDFTPYRIVCQYALFDNKGVQRTTAWQSPDLAWEHCEYPYSTDANVALELLNSLSNDWEVEYTRGFYLVRVAPVGMELWRVIEDSVGYEGIGDTFPLVACRAFVATKQHDSTP